MKPQSLNQVIHQDPALHALAARTEALLPLKRAWQRALPTALGSLAMITGMENGQVLVRVTGNAVAAKLRQMAPTLTTALQKVVPEVTALKIQLATPANSPPVRERPAKRLSANSVAAFGELAQQLEPSPLKTAVERLLKHRSGG